MDEGGVNDYPHLYEARSRLVPTVLYSVWLESVVNLSFRICVLVGVIRLNIYTPNLRFILSSV